MVKLTRLQLYKWVWNYPVTKIAEELKVSGSGLGRKCKLHNVPTPNRGFWHQVQNGKHVQHTPLPYPDRGSDWVSIDVSQERATELDELPMPSEILPATATALDESREERRGLDVDEHTDVFESMDKSNQLDGDSVSSDCSVKQTCVGSASPTDIMALARLHGQSEATTNLIVALQKESQNCDAGTKAVLMLWVKEASMSYSKTDPITQVIQECQRVASGAYEPGWWISLQHRSQVEIAVQAPRKRD